MLYSALGNDSEQRNKRYRGLFDRLNITEQEKLITEATIRGEVYGSDAFHAKVSKLISRVTKLSTHGGDRKSDKYHNQVGCPLERVIRMPGGVGGEML